METDTTTSLFPVSLLITIAALVAVLALAWFALRALARFSTRQSGTHRLRIVQSVSIGHRERLLVLHYGGQEYLLGVCSGRISTIERRDIPADPTCQTAAPTERTEPGSRT